MDKSTATLIMKQVPVNTRFPTTSINRNNSLEMLTNGEISPSCSSTTSSNDEKLEIDSIDSGHEEDFCKKVEASKKKNCCNVNDHTFVMSKKNIECNDYIMSNRQPLLPLPSEDYNLSNENEAHTLNTSWSMYYRNNKEKGVDFPNLETHKIDKVYTVEEFWRLTNFIHLPSQIPKKFGPNLMFFRNDIKPVWEDEANDGGGMWGAVLTSKRCRGQLDSLWIETLLACIGETLNYSDYITGIVIQRRQREDRIQLWTKNAIEKDIQYKIGQDFKELLNLGEEVEICYTKHEDMMTGASNTTRRPSTGQSKNRWSNISRESSINNNRSLGKDKSYDSSESNYRLNSDIRKCSRDTSYGFMLEKMDRLRV